ncbi:MAG: IPExxxVDY family protein [Chitinophagales bacterium]
MPKTKLHIESEDDFFLWGILSSLGGHRIVWELNKVFSCNLSRQDDVVIIRRPVNENLYFSFYTYEDEVDLFKIELIKNKGLGDYYLKELKNFDYLLMVKGELDFFDENEFYTKLKKMPSIQSAIKIDLNNIKNISQLILE